MSIGTIWRAALALLLGAALPHAAEALWATQLLPVRSPALQQALAWALAGLPAAWLLARIAGRRLRSVVLAAAAGGLLALAAPFVAHGLPAGPGTLDLLAVHLVLLGLVWPALILLFARRN